MEKKDIELVAVFKNNEEWYYPQSKTAPILNIFDWENAELLSYYNDDNFLVFCWNSKKIDGRLYKAKKK